MGASISSNSVDIVNDAVINVSMSAVNNCASSTSATQNVTLGGLMVGDSISSTATVSMSCVQNIQLTTDMFMQMASQIQQQAAAQAQALLPAYSGSTNTTNLANHIQVTLGEDFIQKAAGSVSTTQNVVAQGVSIGTSVSLGVSSIQKAMQNILSQTNLSASIMDTTNQSAKSTTDSNPFALSTNMMYMIAFIVVGIVALILLPMLMGGGSSKDKDDSDDDNDDDDRHHRHKHKHKYHHHKHNNDNDDDNESVNSE
jgi:hypothetical protein